MRGDQLTSVRVSTSPRAARKAVVSNSSPAVRTPAQSGRPLTVQQMVGEIQDAEDYGIAVDLNNKELVAKIDKALETLKKNGEYEKIYVKWFGQKPVM